MTDLIKRFVPANELQPGVLALMDRKRNILFINRDFYNRANDRERRELWRCKTSVELSDVVDFEQATRDHNKRGRR